MTKPTDQVSEQEPFGRRLRRYREAAGLSQVALAGEDFDPSYVSLLEADRRKPTDQVIKALAPRLGVAAERLAGDVDLDLDQTLLMAQAALGTGKFDEAISLLQVPSSRVSVESLSSDTRAFQVVDVYATALERAGRFDEATGLFERLREVAEGRPLRWPWLRVTTTLVRCYRDAGDIGRAIDLGEQAMRRYEELGLEGLDGHSALVSTLAGAYGERGDHLRAQVLLDELIAVTDRSGSLDDRAYAYWNAAHTAADRGYAGEGLRLAAQAETLLSVGSDMRSQARLQVMKAWLLLGVQPPDPTAARKILRDVLPALRQHSGAVSVASAEVELARCELLLGRPAVARRLAESALKRFGEEHPIERAQALVALGAAWVLQQEISHGVALLQQAADLLAEAQAPRQAAAVWRQLSAVYSHLGDLVSALDAANRALDGTGVDAAALLPMEAGTSEPRTRPDRRRMLANSS